MRKLELFRNSEKVWIYFATKESGKCFYECASNLNLHFAKGTHVKEKNIGTLMSLTKDGKMAYISMMAWNYGFPDSHNDISENQRTFAGYPKIDFDKFISGDTDYFLRKSPIRPATEDEISGHNEGRNN